MPGDYFSESLTASVISLREHVLANHEREVQRLNGVIESLKAKISKLSNKLLDDENYYGSELESEASNSISSNELEDARLTQNDEKCQDLALAAVKSGSDWQGVTTLSSETTCNTFKIEPAMNGLPLMPVKSMPTSIGGRNSFSQAWFGVPGKNLSLKRSSVSSTAASSRRVSGVSVGRRMSTASQKSPEPLQEESELSSEMTPTQTNHRRGSKCSNLGERQSAEFENKASFKVASAWRTNGKVTRRNPVKGFMARRVSVNSPIADDENGFTDGNFDRTSTGSTSTSFQVKIARISVSQSREFLGLGSMTLATENCFCSCMKRMMLQPSSMKHVCWNLWGLFLIMYDAVTVPLEIFNPPDTLFLVCMAVMSNIYWTLDIVSTFFTGYMTVDGSVHMKPKSVALRYAATWLSFDIFLIICNWVALVTSGKSKSSGVGIQSLDHWRTLQLLRLLRILRLLKAPEMEGFITEHIRSETTRLVASIARLIILLVLVAHFIACTWYGLGRYLADEGNNNSWVIRNGLENKGSWHNYVYAIHWSLSQFAGENIIDLESVVERTFAIVIFIFAFLFATIFVSSITTLMTRLQIIASKQSSQLSALRRYLHDNSISTPLAVRILRNARMAMVTNQRACAEHSVELLQEISDPLQVELHFEVHFPTLAFHPFFKNYNTVNHAGMKKVCHQAVSITWLSTHDVVFSECETPEKAAMYFVVKGELRYTQEGVHGFTKLSRGNWACETVLWATSRQHVGTLSAVTESSLLILDAEKFQRILRHFPTSHARTYGKSYVLHLNHTDKDQVTDVPTLDVEPICEEAFPELCGPPMMGMTWSLRMSNESRRSKCLEHLVKSDVIMPTELAP